MVGSIYDSLREPTVYDTLERNIQRNRE